MRPNLPTERIISLILGLVLLSLGVVLLLAIHKVTDVIFVWWPILPLALGIVLLILAIRKEKSPRFFFSGTLLTLASLFTFSLYFFFSGYNLGLKELWPIYVALVGFSLIPYALRSNPQHRLKLMIPGVFLLFLSFSFLLFSLSIIQQSFVVFVFSWWPLLLIFLGLVLTLGYFLGGKSNPV